MKKNLMNNPKFVYLTSSRNSIMPFKTMIEEVSSIFWAFSLVINIIILLIGLPLCLLICCCCRKHPDALGKDIRTIAKNHKLLKLKDSEEEEDGEEVEEKPKKKKKKQLPQKQHIEEPLQLPEENDELVE